MRGAVTVVLIAACGSQPPQAPAPAPVAPSSPAHPTTAAVGPAWQSFAKSPWTSMYATGRTSWPVGVTEPVWLKPTFANLALTSFDGSTVTGELAMWAAPGLDARTCAAEIVWNDHAGIRLPGPDEYTDEGKVGHHTVWHFRADIGAHPYVHASAYVFCPIDAAHTDPPQGVDYSTVDVFLSGPEATAEFCAHKRDDHDMAPPHPDIATHRTYNLRFACGTLVRTKGRDLVDDCRGDTLVSLDALASDAAIEAPPTGTLPTDAELRALQAGDTACTSLTLSSVTRFPSSAAAPFEAFIRATPGRLTGAWSNDGMPQPSEP